MTETQRPRVAVTGIGMVTGLGHGASVVFERLLRGRSAILPLEVSLGIPFAPIPVAVVDPSDVAEISRNELSWSERLALHAVGEALQQSGLVEAAVELIVGGTAFATREAVQKCASFAPQSIEAFLLALAVESPANLGTALKREQPQITTSTVISSACSSGALSIALGAMRLEQGASLPQVVGGVDALSALTLAGFASLGILSMEPCRPFDVHRKGLNLGEGAAFLVLETERMAMQRGAGVLCWLDGYAVGSEASHLTHPEPSGKTAARLILDAMGRAGFSRAAVRYINAHGTGTIQNDAMEASAIRLALGDSLDGVKVSSSKGQLGHTLGAAGAIEAAIVAQALKEQAVVPTVGLEEPDPDCALNLIQGEGERFAFDAALSCSFGFGGANVVLALGSKERASARTEHGDGQRQSSVVVRAVLTMGPRGVLRDRENNELLLSERENDSLRLPFDPLDKLVMERSRRFDRVTAMTALGVATLLDSIATDRAQTGLLVGNCLGNVPRTAAFVSRACDRGLRACAPAEFPHLLPSSLAANASLYTGLNGPVFNIADSYSASHWAIDYAVTCLRSNCARHMVAAVVESIEPSVMEALLASGVLCPDLRQVAEGGAFVLLETASVSKSDKPSDAADPLAPMNESRTCRLEYFGPYPSNDVEALAAPSPRQRNEVFIAGDDSMMSPVLSEMGWGAARCMTLPRSVGPQWHLASFLFALGAARVLGGDADRVLVISERGTSPHLALFVGQ